MKSVALFFLKKKKSVAWRGCELSLKIFIKKRSQPVGSAYQPPVSSIFLSEQTSHQQPASSTPLSEQISTNHQPPANRTGCKIVLSYRVAVINNF
jgi:hypothetical protein